MKSGYQILEFHILSKLYNVFFIFTIILKTVMFITLCYASIYDAVFSF